MEPQAIPATLHTDAPGATPVDVSINLSTCSRAGMLQDALNALLRQAETVPFRVEFVIVDDGSTDTTPEVLREFQARSTVPVTLLQGPRSGIAAARNLAVQHSRGTWLACCDDDQWPARAWLADLYRTALDTGADFVGGSMHLCLPGTHTIESYGPRARRLLGECGIGDPAGAYPAGRHPATNNVLMHASTVRSLRGFDTTFTQGGEDTDLFARARAAGHRLWFQPLAGMAHRLTERRVGPAGLRWTAMRIGSSDTQMLHRQHGRRAVLRHAGKRAATLLLRDGPGLLLAAAQGNDVTRLDAQCSAWYTEGVLRSLPVLLRPEASGSRSFLASMDFRRRNGERTA